MYSIRFIVREDLTAAPSVVWDHSKDVYVFSWVRLVYGCWGLGVLVLTPMELDKDALGFGGGGPRAATGNVGRNIDSA